MPQNLRCLSGSLLKGPPVSPSLSEPLNKTPALDIKPEPHGGLRHQQVEEASIYGDAIKQDASKDEATFLARGEHPPQRFL